MNKEKRKSNKVIKVRKRRKKFDRQQVEAKIKKDRILRKEKIVYKFEKLEKQIERKKEMQKNPPATQVLSPQKVV